MNVLKMIRTALAVFILLVASISGGHAAALQKINLAAGWFWGVEAGLQKIKGVTTIVGYTGGTFNNPNYRDVCGGRTGHAEAVQVSYDPDNVSLEEILHKFWDINAPSIPEPAQGQYRSAIFFYSKEQEAIARKELAKLEASKRQKIYTEIRPASVFYRAEEYHQNYYKKTGFAGCRIWIALIARAIKVCWSDRETQNFTQLLDQWSDTKGTVLSFCCWPKRWKLFEICATWKGSTITRSDRVAKEMLHV